MRKVNSKKIPTYRKINSGWFIRNFVARIHLPRNKPGKPVILAPAGPSCVGKTTVMKFIQKKLPYFVRISNDEIRMFLYKKGWPDSAIVENFLYQKLPSYKLAEKFLRRGYSIISDDNFATKPVKLRMIKALAKKFEIKFYIIRVWAPSSFIKVKLRKKRFLKSGLFKDWQIAWKHFERSRRQFDYEKLEKLYLAKVNSSKPLAPQLKGPTRILSEAMDL